MERLTFGLFTDLHLDIMHDGEARLDAFLAASKDAQVDFNIQLGDFCYPKDTSYCACSSTHIPVNLANAMTTPTDVPKLELLSRYLDCGVPSYHVLGNHEFDFCSKEETLALYRMKERYYRFTIKGWDFIVLDGNSYKNDEGKIVDYYYGDYFDYPGNLPYVDDIQLKWLEEILEDGDRPTIICSHEPIWGPSRTMKNWKELVQLFHRINETHLHKIKMCMAGHLHLDRMHKHDGIWYYCMNSISNHWIGTKYAASRFNAEIERKYPNLRYTFPYKEPVFAIVHLDGSGMRIQGHKGSFFQPGPRAMHVPYRITATVQDRNLPWLG